MLLNFHSLPEEEEKKNLFSSLLSGSVISFLKYFSVSQLPLMRLAMRWALMAF